MIQKDAELAVLGSIFISDDACSFACQQIPDDHFLDSKNKTFFKAAKRIHSLGVPIDITTFYGNLKESEKKVLTNDLIINATEAVTKSANVRHYADLIRKKYVTQELSRLYEKASVDPSDKDTQREIRKLWDQFNVSGDSAVSISQSMVTYMQTLEARSKGLIKRLQIGFKNIDDAIRGFDMGNLVVFGARPSIGKSAILINITINLLKDKKKVLFVSAEMMWDEILDRMMSIETGIPGGVLRAGNIKNWPKVTSISSALADLPMTLLEGGKMSMGRIRLAVEAVCPDVLVIDFIQRFNPPDSRMNRPAFYSDMANELKEIALNRKILVLVASQFSRDIEKQERDEPLLSDLKESGGIEEAADKVFLFKAEKDNPLSKTRGIKLFLKKNRQGPTGIFYFIFDKQKTKFIESDESDYNLDKKQEKIIYE